MTVQLTADIDEATKQKFNMVCEALGVSPTNAVGMMVSAVISSHSLPSIPAAQPPRPKMSRQEMFGCMRGQFWMSDDFDAPLEDFKDYM